VDSGGPKEPCISWGPGPHTSRGYFEGEKRPAQDMPRYTQNDSTSGSTGTMRMRIGVY